MEGEGDKRRGEKGKENAGTKEEEEGKAAGKRGGIARGRWGNEAENTHKGNGKPKDGDRRGRKDNKEKEVPGRKTHKENIGHVSGGVHKGEINKEEAKDVKEEEVPRLERRQRKWEDRGIRIGTTNYR